MDYIFIKHDKKTNKYLVSAIKIMHEKGERKIPHPIGNDTIEFDNIEDAKLAIQTAGFKCVLPDGKMPIEKEINKNNLQYDKVIFEALLKEAQSSNSNIVASAIESLSEINSQNCLKLFLEKIGEDNEKIRNNSIDAIVKYGPKAIKELIIALQTDNWVKRNSIIICLQRFCKLENIYIEEIINILLHSLNDDNPIVRCSVIKALGLAYKNYKSRN